MLRIEIGKPVQKEIKSLPLKHQRQILSKIQGLSLAPKSTDSIKMKGKATAWRRADSGEYRVIYQVEKDVLRIGAVGHRNVSRVYRDFERKL